MNGEIYNSLENVNYIKEVNKKYIKIYNDADSVTTCIDKVWLLSCSEIWHLRIAYLYPTGEVERYGEAIAKEGERYKYYAIINADSSLPLIRGSDLRRGRMLEAIAEFLKLELRW